MPQEFSPAALPGRFVTVAVLTLASLTIMANGTIAPSLPGLKAHFSSTPGIDTLAGLILSLPSLAVLLTAGLAGWIADRFDRRILLVGSALLYAAGGASGLVAGTLPQLLAGRFVLGLGVAGTMTLALATGADLWQGPARARFMGWQGASMSAGGIVVFILGGALAGLHWRGAFAVYLLSLPVAALAYAALTPYARSRQAEVAARDGAATNTAVPDAVFPWRVFAFVGVLAFLFMASFYVMPTRLPFRLAEIGVTNTLTVGLVMALFTVASLPGSLFYGRIRRVLSPLSVFAASFALMGAGMFVISQAGTLVAVIAGVVVCGIGMGPSIPNYSTYFMGFVPPSLRGRASGLLTTAFFAGQFASPLVSAPLVATWGLAGAFQALAVILAVIATCLVAVAWRGEVQPAAA